MIDWQVADRRINSASSSYSCCAAQCSRVVNPIPFNTLRPQFVQLSAHDAAMLEPATAEDHVRRLAISVKLCYTRQNAPVLPSVPISSREGTGTLAVIPSTQASFRFPPPRQTAAMFGNINVHYNAWSEYVEPTVYALRDRQLDRRSRFDI